MPERYTDEELRAIVGCSWDLGAAWVPSIEAQRAVHDKALAELGARGEAVSALNALVYRHATDGELAGAWAQARRALAGLGYALPDPDGGEHREEEERGPQGRQDQAERAQGHCEGEGEAGGAALTPDGEGIYPDCSDRCDVRGGAVHATDCPHFLEQP